MLDTVTCHKIRHHIYELEHLVAERLAFLKN